MRLLALLVVGLLAIAAPGVAVAQNNWVTPGNSTAGGSVQMCLNSAQQAVPCNPGSSGGPAVVQANAAGTTGAVNVTLPAVAGKTTYLCGFAVSAIGSGAVGPITISGLFGSSNPTFQGTATAAGGVVALTPVDDLVADAHVTALHAEIEVLLTKQVQQHEVTH